MRELIKTYYSVGVRHCYKRLSPGFSANYVIGFFNPATRELEHKIFTSAN
jgi:hypothetical protein